MARLPQPIIPDPLRALRFIREKCVAAASGCIEYTGAIYTRSGHVQLYFGGRNSGRRCTRKMYAHRFVYVSLVGPVGDGQHVCHTCDNPRCVNIDHLWLGTQRENSLDMVAKKRQAFMSKTHCKQGHEFTPENTRMTAGGRWRQCKACQQIRMRITAGWTREEAVTLPKLQPWERPRYRRKPKAASSPNCWDDYEKR